MARDDRDDRAAARRRRGARERFRGGSVFARPCPHAIAARRESARRAYARRGDRGGAVELMRDGLQRRARGAAPPARARRLPRDRRRRRAAPRRSALWTAIADDERVTSSLRADAFERLARVAALDGDCATARADRARRASCRVDPNERRQLDAECVRARITRARRARRCAATSSAAPDAASMRRRGRCSRRSPSPSSASRTTCSGSSSSTSRRLAGAAPSRSTARSRSGCPARRSSQNARAPARDRGVPRARHGPRRATRSRRCAAPR